MLGEGIGTRDHLRDKTPPIDDLVASLCTAPPGSLRKADGAQQGLHPVADVVQVASGERCGRIAHGDGLGMMERCWEGGKGKSRGKE